MGCISGQFFVSALSVCGSIPKSPVPPYILRGDVAWYPASRTVYRCLCPPVGFCATSHSWVLCLGSPCSMLTWFHQTFLLKWSLPVKHTFYSWQLSNLTHKFFSMYIFIYSSLHVSSISCSSSGETDCINAASGNCHSVLVAVSCAGWE